jgi:hypothetical protein
MKAEERKEIETNSLVHAVQKVRERVTGRTLYYVIGTAALVIGGILLYRYLTGEKSRNRDAGLMQLINADTAEKLKQGMEDHRGTTLGSTFKLQLARHLLLNEGLPKLGTDNSEARKQAANAVADARTYYLELTGELKQKEEAALVQESWHSAAQAEEALVGLPTAPGGTDSRGNVDKAVEYYEKSASIFPDSEPSKRDKARAEKIKANKDQFVADQKKIYAERPAPPSFDTPRPGIGGHGLGPLPGTEPPPAPKADATPKVDAPTPPKADVPAAPKIEVPALPPPPTPDPKKTPDPKPPETPKADPKAK